jgi:PAS domain S-box-containing protein
VVLVFRDVTEQYRKDEQLRRSEENLRAIFNAAKNVALIITDIDVENGKILEFSPGAETIFGYSRQEAIGMPAAVLHLAEDVEKFPAIREEMAANRPGFNGESTLVRKSGETFPSLFTTYPVLAEDGAMIAAIGVAIDISKQKEAEVELLKMEKLQSIGTLAGGLAHDFNNIMMGLFGNISLAKMKLAADNPARGFIEKAEQSLERATGLTNQLLTFAKGGAPLREEVSLPELVEQTVQFDLSGSSVKAVFETAPDLWKASVDRGQMHQVFSNLTINARQAMEEGGILTIAMDNCEIASFDAVGLPSGKYLKITVADQGRGIDRQYLGKIFDPYFTTRQGGRGLGLATTYSIIAKHGGLIEVDSEVGRGTTFTLYLPALETGETAPVVSKETLEKKAEVAKRLRILLMDDEEMVRQVVQEMLEVLDFDVETAVDGADALEKYRQAMVMSSPFDGVIMDLTIPGGMGGKVAVQKLLEIDPDAKAIVSSGYADDPIMAGYGEYGFKGVIAKPYKIDEMQKELARIFAVRAAEKM